MEHETLSLFLGSVDVILGLLFVLVGLSNSRKDTTGDEFLASFSVSIWWYTIGAALIMLGTVEFLDILWRPDFALHLTQQMLLVGMVCVGLFSISYYFGYLFLGPNRLWIAVAVFYGSSAAALLYLINLQQPIGLDMEAGDVGIIYRNELPEFGLVLRMAALLFVPPLLGMIGYISLYRRVPSTLQRLRIIFVSAIIALMFTSPLLTRIIPLETGYTLLAVTRILSLVAIFCLLATYHPPKAVQRLLETMPHEGPQTQ